MSVVGVDPGSTTGLCVVTIDKAWLRGMGAPTWEGLGAVIRAKAAYQVGREGKMFDIDRDRSTALDRNDADSHLMPILSNQPLFEEDGMRSTERFQAILEGEHVAGGGPLTVDRAGEILQVRQIAGLLYNYEEAALVIESFQLRTDVRSAEVLSPDRLRLAIEAEEILHGAGRVPFLQTPADAKQTATNDRLKRAGLWFPGMQHACDAARHVALFLRECRKHESLRAAAWPAHFKEFED